MPQTKTQGAVFGLLMSYFMALGMEVANVAHKLGAMSNAVFLPALKETAFMGAIVFVVSMLYGSRAGQHIAHKFVRPGRDNPLLVTLAVSGCTVMVMCPSMSLIATALFTGIDAEFFARSGNNMRIGHDFTIFRYKETRTKTIRQAYRVLICRQAYDVSILIKTSKIKRLTIGKFHLIIALVLNKNHTGGHLLFNGRL